MASENLFLLYALVMGIFVTFVYDILRIARRVFPHSNLLVSLEDLGFWIYCAAEVFSLMNRLSDGTLRWFAVMGAVAGIFLYKKLVSPWLVKYSSLVLGKLVEGLMKALGLLWKPFGIILRKIKAGMRRAAGRANRRRKKVNGRFKKRLTYFIRMLKMSL